jgi:hypothetical protein
VSYRLDSSATSSAPVGCVLSILTAFPIQYVRYASNMLPDSLVGILGGWLVREIRY